MMVRNWMKRDPTTVTSDTLVSKAKRLLVEHNLRALPVVDDGVLRGMVTRVNCLRAAEHVARTEDPHEFDYFVNRLKVKDLMVRHPIAVEATDTMETCLRKGQDHRVSQFPVIEDGRVVGIVSAAEVFHLAARMLGVWDKWMGLTLAPVPIGPGVLGRVAQIIDQAGATLHSLITVGPGQDDRRIVVRFTGGDLEQLVTGLTAAGHQVLEVCTDSQRCREIGPYVAGEAAE